ncbi:MAG: cytochrome ubiquinol oxidase subunit I [Pseudomonadota bacterium]
MDAVLLARIQFAFTVGFHYIFPPITIGMAWLIFWFQTRYLQTGDELYKKISDFWIRLFGITFAVGVATGITMEFQFGTNWAEYSRVVGDIFGAPLAAEGLTAFFLESTFLAVLIYGQHKVSKKFYWFSGLMVAVGSTLSAFWIIVANAWQQAPAGFELVNGKAVLVNFWAAAFNSATIPTYLHTINGALVTGAFFVMGLSAWFILKGQHLEFAKKSLIHSMIYALISALLVLGTGDRQAMRVAKDQPAKLAAFEGLWETQAQAPLLLFGLPCEEKEQTFYSISIPGALSLLVSGNSQTTVIGLKDIAKEDRPPIFLTFASFHNMVAMGFYLVFLPLWGVILWRRKKIFESKCFLKLALYSIPIPIIANELGWIAAEVGRQPWVVYNVLRTKDAISMSVPAGQILLSLILFGLVYALLFVLWIYLLRAKLVKGPDA